MQTVTVHASRQYDVVIGQGLLQQAGRRIAAAIGCAVPDDMIPETAGPGTGADLKGEGRKPGPKAAGLQEPTRGKTAMLVSDDRVYALYGETVRTSLENAGFRVLDFVFPHGEASKNLQTYGALLGRMCAGHMSRTDVVAALGGGVTGDLAGFAAATYQRGTGFVQIPTSLLAAVDSSVGGKTAVDLPEGKNQAGCFYQPSLVLCDTNTLDTLPEEEYKNGCAEIIKYGMIGDRDFFFTLLKSPVREHYEDVIARCVAMKRDVVEQDEFDTGLRMLLNFGHTFGHAVEACSAYSVPHGQAVAIGMASIARAACRFGFCTGDVPETVGKILDAYGLPTELPYRAQALADAALSDKKAQGGSIRLIVPAEIGRCLIEKVSREDLTQWLRAGGAL